MTLNDYQTLVKRTSANGALPEARDRLACYALGAAGEAGEVADLFKKHLFHRLIPFKLGKPRKPRRPFRAGRSGPSDNPGPPSPRQASRADLECTDLLREVLFDKLYRVALHVVGCVKQRTQKPALRGDENQGPEERCPDRRAERQEPSCSKRSGCRCSTKTSVEPAEKKPVEATR